MESEKIINDLLDLYLNNFDVDKGNYPTTAWLSGMFRKVQDFKNIEHFLDDVKILPEQKEKLQKIKLFKDFALKNGLITPTMNGFFKQTDKGSKLAQKLSSSIEEYKKFDAHRTPFGRSPEYKKTWYDFVAGVNLADEEWAQSLSKTNLNFLKIYSEFTPIEFHILKKIFKAGKDQQKIIKSIYDHHPEVFNKLIELKIINSTGDINKKLLLSLFIFLGKSGYSRLKNFNKEIAYSVDRSAANKAINKNYAERQFADSPRANELGKKVSSFIKNTDNKYIDKIKEVFNSSKLSPELKNYLIKNDILDAENSLTTFGKLLKYVLMSNKKIEDYQDKLYNFKFANPTEFPVPDKLSRKTDLASDRKKSFKNFLEN